MSQGDVDDLWRRLSVTRFPDDPDNIDGDYGFPAAGLRELVDHWRHSHDWRATQERMNALEQYAVTVDGANHHVFVARDGVQQGRPLRYRVNLLVHRHICQFGTLLRERRAGPLASRA
ncbi:epoxide hydrolase N-terminal domain-containing protein [Glaciibacter sp. 2TAF33]|uniref:epoxide hydrolase N-terminal domain-containing protein n=1 Tax=Glaciibacter sp. 2TAF33 TaxID=3233015 RepID=UPI003F8E4028